MEHSEKVTDIDTKKLSINSHSQILFPTFGISKATFTPEEPDKLENCRMFSLQIKFPGLSGFFIEVMR